MQAPSRPVRNIIPQKEPESYWHRGVRFDRSTDWNGNVVWSMSWPVKGPRFANTRDARRWCNDNGVFHPGYVSGSKHDLSDAGID